MIVIDSDIMKGFAYAALGGIFLDYGIRQILQQVDAAPLNITMTESSFGPEVVLNYATTFISILLMTIVVYKVADVVMGKILTIERAIATTQREAVQAITMASNDSFVARTAVVRSQAEVTSAMEEVRAMARTVDRNAEEVKRMLVPAAAQVGIAAGAVSMASQGVTTVVDGVVWGCSGWVLLQTIVCVLGLGRILYNRLKPKPAADPNLIEGKAEADLKIVDIYTIFDCAIMAAVTPLLVCQGAESAVKVWQRLKVLCRMIRDVCTGVQLYHRIVAEPSDQGVLGAETVEKIADTCDSLIDRASERKQMNPVEGIDCDELKSEDETESDRASSEESTDTHYDEASDEMVVANGKWSAVCKLGERRYICVACNFPVGKWDFAPDEEILHSTSGSDCGPFFACANSACGYSVPKKAVACQCGVAKLQPPYILSTWIPMQFRTKGFLPYELPAGVKELPVSGLNIPVASPVDAYSFISGKTAKLVTKEESKYIKRVLDLVDDKKKPWLLPVGVLAIFAMLLIVAALVQKARKKVPTIPSKPFGPSTRERYVAVQDAKEDRKNRRWIFYDRSNGNMLEPDDYMFDEAGNLLSLYGRRINPDFEPMITGDYGNLIARGQAIEKPKTVTFAAPEVAPSTTSMGDIQKMIDRAVAADIAQRKRGKDVDETKCTKPGCNGGCDKWHKPVSADKAAKRKLARLKKKAKGKTEALINGQKFKPQKAMESVGYARATALDGAKHHEMNATRVWGGVTVSKHLFEGIDSTHFTVYMGNEELILDVKKGVQIGNDTLFFRTGETFKTIPSLRLSEPQKGEAVHLVTWDSWDDFMAGKFSTSHGNVVSVLPTVDNKPFTSMAYYTCSSIEGNCSGPVINEHGHCVGFHNNTNGVINGFIPVSKHMAAIATNSPRGADF